MKSELGKAGVVMLILALGGAALLSDPMDASASSETALGGVTLPPSITPSPYEPYTLSATAGDIPAHTLLMMGDLQLDRWRPSVGPDMDQSSSFFMMNR